MIATSTYRTFNPYDNTAECIFKITGGTTIAFQLSLLNTTALEVFVVNVYRSYDGYQWVATETGTSNVSFTNTDYTKVSDEFDARAPFWKLCTKPGSGKSTSNNNLQITAMLHSNTESPEIECLTPPASAY